MPATPPPIAIGVLSRRTGCHIETIRYYERVGLLPPPSRSAGGYRLYGDGHVRRLSFIRRARDLGFALGDVRTLLELADKRQRSCRAARDLAAAHLADVRAKIADLRALEAVLIDMVARCADGTLPDCPMIEVLYRDREGKVEAGRAGKRAHKRRKPPDRGGSERRERGAA